MTAEQKKLASFDRIRAIQHEMMHLAKTNGWLQIEQRTAPDPLDLVDAALSTSISTDSTSSTSEEAVGDFTVEEEMESKDLFSEELSNLVLSDDGEGDVTGSLPSTTGSGVGESLIWNQ